MLGLIDWKSVDMQAAIETTHGLMTFPLGEDFVLWREDDTRLFLLNASARVIWQGQASGLPVGAIAQQLVDRFAVSLAQAEQDTRAALASWRRAGLFHRAELETVVDPPTAPPERLPSAPPPPWAEHTLQLAGTMLHVRYGDIGLYRTLRPLLEHLESPSGMADTVFDLFQHADGDYLLGQDGAVLIRSRQRDDLIAHALYQVLNYPCQQAPALAILHAAGVAAGDGYLLLAAPGGHGKTTLTAALLAEGLDYLGDDLILLSRDNPPLAWPLPGPLCLKAGSWPVLKPYYPGLEELPVCTRRDQPVRYLPPPRPTSTQARPIQGLLFPRYQPGHPTRLEPISPGTALHCLLAANAQLRPPLHASHIRGFLAWLDHVPAYRLTYESLSEAVAAVYRVLDLNALEASNV